MGTWKSSSYYWQHLQAGHISFFLLGWHLTGPFVLVLTKIIRQDLTVLGVIFVVILGGFASAQIILGVESVSMMLPCMYGIAQQWQSRGSKREVS